MPGAQAASPEAGTSSSRKRLALFVDAAHQCYRCLGSALSVHLANCSPTRSPEDSRPAMNAPRLQLKICDVPAAAEGSPRPRR